MPYGHEALRVIERVHIIAKARGYTHASNHNPLVVWSVSSYGAPLCIEAVLVISTSSALSVLLGCAANSILSIVALQTCALKLLYMAQARRNLLRYETDCKRYGAVPVRRVGCCVRVNARVLDGNALCSLHCPCVVTGDCAVPGITLAGLSVSAALDRSSRFVDAL